MTKAITFEGCAGWLHEAPFARGVVLVSAHGFEELCSRRFLRILADRLAAVGLPVLRFDPYGTGDSGGDLPDDWARWIGDTDAAVERLKAETGVTEVALVGLRLGAMLAAEIAARRSDICMLTLLAPPASGRAYMREQVALARMIEPGGADHAGAAEIAGFPIPTALRDDIAAFQWSIAKDIQAREVFLAAAGTKVAGVFAEQDLWLTADPFTGYARLMCDPTASEVPHDLVETLAGWLSADAPARQASRTPADPCAVFDPIEGEGWIEEAIRFGPDSVLAGIHCRPRHGNAQNREAFVFLNAGAIPHGGWARMTVDHARYLAAAGFASLRIDLAGIGDSRHAPGSPRRFLYSEGAREDVLAALGWLGSEGYGRFVLIGACSGAYQAFQASRGASCIVGLVLVNPLCLRWSPDHAVALTAWKRSKAAVVSAGRQRDGHVGRLAGTAKALGLSLAKSVAKRGLAMLGDFADLLTAILEGDEHDSPVARRFRELSRGGTRVLLVHSAGDPSLGEVARHVGPNGERISDLAGFETCILPDADHVLTQAAARAALRDRLLAFAAGPLPVAAGMLRPEVAPLVASPIPPI